MFSPLRYLMTELGIRTSDWGSLDDKDKTDLKQWATDEAAAFAAEGKVISNA
jgi:hypothetical protein